VAVARFREEQEPADRGKGDRWPFVGRETVFAAIMAALADPARGTGGVVLAGPAGAGKSRLAYEVVRRVDRGRYVVRQVSATSANTGTAFGALASFVPVRPTVIPSQNVVVTAMADRLAEAPPGRRAVVVVDDAHLLDEGSIAVLRHLLCGRSAFVIVAARTGVPGMTALLPLWSEGFAERVDLPALSEAETGQVLREALRGQAAMLTVQRMHELTCGNPLLLRELTVSGLATAALAESNGVWTWNGPWLVAPRLTELVQSRLGDLAESERRALELVALSEPVGLGVITRLVSEEVLEGLEHRGLLWVQQDRRRAQLRLAHPLYGEALRAACLPLRTRIAKRRLSEALAATGARRADDVLQIAQWRLDAGVPVPAETLLKAAHRAWSLLDLPLAERLAGAALAAASPDGEDKVVAQAGRLMWRVLISGERHAELLAMIDAIAPRAITPPDRAKMWFARAVTEFWGMGDHSAATRSLDQVEESGMPAVADEKAALRAVFSALAGDLPAARDVLCSSDVTAMVNGDSAAKARVAAELVVTYGGSGLAGTELVRLTCEPLPEAEDVPWVRPVIRLLGVQRELLAGQLATAAELAAEAHRVALLSRWEFAIMLAAIGHAQLARFAGRLDDADRFLREAEALHQRRSTVGRVYWRLLEGERAWITAMTGDRDAVREPRSPEWPAGGVFGLWAGLAEPWLTAARGAAAQAREQAVTFAEQLRESGAHALEVLARHDAHRLGSPDQRQRLHELAESDTNGPAPLYARHAGAASAGELEAIAAEFQRLGRQPLAIDVYRQAARAYADEGRTDSSRRCRALAESTYQHCPGLPNTITADDLALTARERQTALLALSGLANRQIAAEIGVAKRTVDNHLASAYHKLGINSRADLGRFLGGGAE
jgi:DNA-binding CsgD family transcriptional regulator/type II secretory pathway predicted ATPase ExeA